MIIKSENKNAGFVNPAFLYFNRSKRKAKIATTISATFTSIFSVRLFMIEPIVTLEAPRADDFVRLVFVGRPGKAALHLLISNKMQKTYSRLLGALLGLRIVSLSLCPASNCILLDTGFYAKPQRLEI